MSPPPTSSHAATPSGRPERPPRDNLLGSAVWSGLRRALLGLMILLLLPAAAWLWAGSEGSLATALRWVAQAQSDSRSKLLTSGVTGSLRAGGQAAELTWQSPGLTLRATGVDLHWEPLALLRRSLQVQHLRMAALEVQAAERSDAQPATPPASLRLALPGRLGLVLEDVEIGQLRWLGATPFETGKLRGNYAYAGAQHQLGVTELFFAGGRYQGRLRVDSDAPFALEAGLSGALTAALPSAASDLPLTFQASAQGSLTDLKLQAELRSPGPGKENPEALLTAHLPPWQDMPVPDAQASFRALDLALLWPAAPQTRLNGSASVRPLPGKAWQIRLDARNASPGPWDRQRLPAEQVQAEGEWRDSQAFLTSLDARLGGGKLQGSGQWTPISKAKSAGAQPPTESPWQVRAKLDGVQAAALYSALPAQRISGSADLALTGPRLGFDLALQASGAQIGAKASAPAATRQARLVKGSSLITQIGQLQLRELSARGAWVRARPAARGAVSHSLDLSSLQLRSADAELRASGQFQPSLLNGRGEITLRAPGLTLNSSGELQANRGDGQLTLDSTDVQRALRWLGDVPGLQGPGPWQNAAARGQGRLSVAWQGGWRDPQLQVLLKLPQLDWQSTPDMQTLRLRQVQASLNGRLSQAQLQLQGQAERGAGRLSLLADGQAGAVLDTRRATPVLLRWQGLLRQLQISLQEPSLGPAPWRLDLKQAVSASGTPESFALDAGQAALTAPAALSSAVPGTPTQAVLAWQAARWQSGEWTTAGTLRGLPLAWAEALLGSPLGQAGLSGPLLFDGQWNAVVGQQLQLTAELARSSGDLTVQAETTEGRPARVAAGLREARINVQSAGGNITAQVRWASERAGNLQADLRTQLLRTAPSGQTEARWTWPQDAALSGQIKAQLPRIGAWSVLAPPGWRLRGALTADLRVKGTRSDPQLQGTLEANDLALRSVVDGIELGNGRLRAQLEGTRMRITEFMLQGAGPRGTGGLLRVEGEAAWVDGRPQVNLSTRLERLRVSVRNDRQIMLSGQLQAALTNGQPEINGLLKIDQARITLPAEDRPQLGEDVVIRTADGTQLAKTLPGANRRPRTPVKLAVQIDLGENFVIQGRGVNTRMSGILALLGDSLATPRLYGTLLTANGEYRAYGQRLDIEEGVLRFAGPLDNPALDILAIRPNLTQRVGVQISGTALLPRVRLYAEPELPDAEKLSWLVLGRSSASGGAEAALLQQAALALLGSRTGTNTGGLAASLGLDELSLRAPGSNAEPGSPSAGAITLGKRFSRNFYAAYERSLSGAVGTLFLFYDLSQRLTLRAQAGEQAAVDLIFTVPYE